MIIAHPFPELTAGRISTPEQEAILQLHQDIADLRRENGELRRLILAQGDRLTAHGKRLDLLEMFKRVARRALKLAEGGVDA